MSGTLYCIDTSALIDWLERYYPPAAFPAIVAKVDVLIDEGRLFLSAEVWEEVQVKDEAAKTWCTPRKDNLIVPTGSPRPLNSSVRTRWMSGWAASTRWSVSPAIRGPIAQ
jgi:hypothetical protein